MKLKPYPEYKDSGLPWLGDIPEHWEARRIKNVCRFTYGDSLPDDFRQEGEVAVFGSNGQVGIHNVANTRGPCLVVGRKGSFGKVNYSEKPVFAIDTTYFVDQQATTANLRWLFYLLSWARLDAVSKDSAVPGLARDEAYTQLVPYCGVYEQSQIANYLDAKTRQISRFIRNKRRLIELLQEQKQAIINRAVTRGLNPDVRLKPSGVEWLGDMPEHWEIRRIKTLFREKDQRSGDGQGLLLSLTRARGIVPQAEASNRVASAGDLSKYKICRPGDLVMNRMQAWSGMFAVPPQEGLVSPDYSVFGPIGASNVKYFEHLFKTSVLVDQFAQRSKGIGSGFNRLYTPDFGSVPVVVPPLSEQNAIVEHLENATADIHIVIDRTRREIELLREYRTRLIADVVTGKVDVRDIPVEAVPEDEALEECVEAEEMKEALDIEEVQDADY